jgi:hypothetical protein
MPGTHNDAFLIVELLKLGAMIGLPDAAETILADDFDPDAVELSDRPIRVVLGFFETVGTLVENGLLDRDLVNDWVWVPGIWARVGPAAKRARERLGADNLYENMEALAAAG